MRYIFWSINKLIEEILKLLGHWRRWMETGNHISKSLSSLGSETNLTSVWYATSRTSASFLFLAEPPTPSIPISSSWKNDPSIMFVKVVWILKVIVLSHYLLVEMGLNTDCIQSFVFTPESLYTWFSNSTNNFFLYVTCMYFYCADR